MHINREEIDGLDRIFRLNLINSVTGIKPANLVGTRSLDGRENLAIISSVVHIGSNPPLIGFFVRPSQQTRRHSYINLRETGVYSINHLPSTMSRQGHWTSAKFGREESEFAYCGFTPEYIEGFPAPLVQESRIKIALEFRQAIPVSLNDTTLVIGEVIHLLADDELIGSQGALDLEQSGSAGISGVSGYYVLNKTAEYPYARREELPDTWK
ncbi:flavin reductase family protein [Salinispira pacifica]|uniref:Flavin reductase like domain-containing protein n=1 Tax=Salinispira pacifica TaxID=1307761 RepID=V5WJD7_9SPIO|nr:flavin reductase family protein [Salinispira pacifica]AHC15664.1 hypothetical protein L21SP2_2307 [Salinispira pacifica]